MTEIPMEAIAAIETPASIRGDVSLETFYELERIVQELVAEYAKSAGDEVQDPLFRVAVQFPDELLDDSLDVCWLLEEQLADKIASTPLVFCLGDTTVASCCPDEVAALHLQADVLVHYGHACLSPTGTLPVIYSFGQLEFDTSVAVQAIQSLSDVMPAKLLLLYQVGYHHAMSELQEQLSENNKTVIVVGQIPQPTQKKTRILQQHSCCGNHVTGGCANLQEARIQEEQVMDGQSPTENCHDTPTRHSLVVGGLELPDTIATWDDLTDYTILFIGESESTSQRQYVNIMLRFLSLTTPPQAYWTYSPKEKTITASIPSNLQKQLNRRFFLTQKARDAHVFGILVSNLSQQHLVEVVKSLKKKIQDAGKASYSFAVGKINPAKLSNFAEIECFVLVACREHSLLSNEREYPVPVVTPLELDVALGNLEWGAQAYSLDCLDVLHSNNLDQESTGLKVEDDDDVPYFSLVTGKYVQKSSTTTEALDLELLPGQGQVTEYRSEAANFLKQREYRGLESLEGQSEVKAAIAGQKGIASNYSGS